MKNKNGSILAFSVFASGVTTAAILNDAGALNVFSVFGSSYGYSILWELVAMAVVLIVVQEMMSRMAVATGKGLSDLIRENFGVKMSFIAMSILFVSSICSAVANFSGIAESMELIGAGKYIGVFAAATAVILIALAKNRYRVFEKVFIILQIGIFFYIVLIFCLKPDFSSISAKMMNSNFELSSSYLMMVIAVVGAVGAPYMQFYMQYFFVNKAIPVKDYGYERVAVYTGSAVAIILDFIIVICSFEVFGKGGIMPDTIYKMSLIFSPLSENYNVVFGAVMFSVSFLGCLVIPGCTAFSICEAFGFETGEDGKLKEAPVFLAIFILIVAASAIVVLMSEKNLFHIIFAAQTAAGILCCIMLVFIIKIAGDREVMGSKVNNRAQNIIMWTFICICTAIFIVAVFVKLFL